MNCQEFEAHTIDLAREQLMDAGARQAAFAHAESCARCGVRLSDELSLTAGLKRVAASEDVEEAPARVEALLLDAFRASRTSSLAPITAERARSRKPLLWIAAAAAIIVLALITALQLNRADAPVERQATEEEPAPAPAAPPALAGPIVAQQTESTRIGQPEVNKGGNVSRTPRETGRKRDRSKPDRRPDPALASPEATEIATEFITLNGAGSLAQHDSGQIVRVELPRSALLSFGLPMNMERADERIKADVIVGNDGLARAIRFVR